tara:strand:- start:1556 stop:2731 length:1176 start_codon:yes stop_codon:yes gene_type:complete
VTHGIPDNEVSALMDLYDATNGQDWRYKWNWGSTNPCVTGWFGVSCDAEGSHVITLDLYENNLNGTLPSTISGLTALRHLHLWTNNLVGTIPSSLGQMSQLLHLYLNNNLMRGELPTELGNATALVNLFLHHNYFTGILPPSLKHLSKLVYLDAQYNALTGRIPLYVCKIGHVYLENNYFSCPEPECCLSPKSDFSCGDCWELPHPNSPDKFMAKSVRLSSYNDATCLAEVNNQKIGETEPCYLYYKGLPGYGGNITVSVRALNQTHVRNDFIFGYEGYFIVPYNTGGATMYNYNGYTSGMMTIDMEDSAQPLLCMQSQCCKGNPCSLPNGAQLSNSYNSLHYDYGEGKYNFGGSGIIWINSTLGWTSWEGHNQNFNGLQPKSELVCNVDL